MAQSGCCLSPQGSSAFASSGAASVGSNKEFQLSDGAGAFVATTNMTFESSAGSFGNNGIIFNSNLQNAALEIREFSGAGVNPRTEYVASRGTIASPTPVLSGDRIGSISFSGNTNTGPLARENGCQIVGFANQNWSSGVGGSRLQFHTNADGGVANALAMTIENDGRVSFKDGSFTAPSWTFDTDATGSKGFYRRGSTQAACTYELFRLEISGGVSQTGYESINYGITGDAGGRFSQIHSRGSQASPTATLNGDRLGALDFLGNRNAAGLTEEVGARINVLSEGTFGAANTPTRMEFRTGLSGSLGTALAMTLESTQGITAEEFLSVRDDLSSGTPAIRGIIDTDTGVALTGSNTLGLTVGGVTEHQYQSGRYRMETNASSPKWETRGFDTSNGSRVILRTSGGTIASPSPTPNNTPLGIVMFGGNWSTGSYTEIEGCWITGYADELWDNSPQRGGGRMEFFTSPNGGFAAAVNCMTLESNHVVTVEESLAIKDSTAAATPSIHGKTDTNTGINIASDKLDIVNGGINDHQFSARIYQLTSEGNAPTISIRSHGDASDGPRLYLECANGSKASPSALTIGNVLGSHFYTGHNGSTFIEGALVQIFADVTWTGSVNGARMEFKTTPNTSQTPLLAMTLESTQRVKCEDNFLVQDAGTTNRIETDSTGIGFFAATPVAKPTVTGSRAGNAALADLLTELASLGLITDSSSA